MEFPKVIEKLSWLAGIVSAVLAFVTIFWQVRSAIKKGARKGDWEIMDRAFQGVRIGAPIASLQNLGFDAIARSGSGAVKTTKWQLENGNEMSVTYDSVQDRILYMEIDWSEETYGTSVGIADLVFGKSTLKQIRNKFGSNGFCHAERMMTPMGDSLVAFNAFELKQTPTIIVIFITKLHSESERHINSMPSETLKTDLLGEHFKLNAIAVADESYLDEIWGKDKLYDPKSIPIKL